MAGNQSFDLQQIDDIIIRDNSELLVRISRQLGQELARGGLTTHQLRNLFGEVRRIAMELEQAELEEGSGSSIRPSTWRRILLLRPRMAYQASRIQRRDNPMLRLVEVLDRAIERIERDPERFRRFADFVEAIVAYHRYFQTYRGSG